MVLAVQAPGGFCFRFFFGIAEADLFEISVADERGLLGNRRFLQCGVYFDFFFHIIHPFPFGLRFLLFFGKQTAMLFPAAHGGFFIIGIVSVSADDFVEVYQMAVEIRAVDAGEFGLSADG